MGVMRHFDYQRTIIAYHGCDESVLRRVLWHSEPLSQSENDYDWLGYGIYFWEFGPERALEWAFEQKKRNPKRIRKPAVLGAVIQLGNCFDLLDTRYTKTLAEAHEAFVDTRRQSNLAIPHNRGLLHDLDCSVINFALPRLESVAGVRFQSVRGCFQEGIPAFIESEIRMKSHVQVAVRDPDCILGYFRPTPIL